MKDELFFKPLLDYLHLLPGMDDAIGSGALEGGGWWVKFSIDIAHPLAWNLVQELGHVLNYVSINERLPTVFKPVSPPPYLNGGPKDFLSWVIECKDEEFLPQNCTEWLEGRLPRPVTDLAQWNTDEDGDVERPILK